LPPPNNHVNAVEADTKVTDDGVFAVWVELPDNKDGFPIEELKKVPVLKVFAPVMV
jgi:hypothetical protein